MDFWIVVLNTRLESPEFEYNCDFVGGKINIQKDYLDDEESASTSSSGYLIHAYFQPIEFIDRPLIADICFRYGNRRREILSVFLQNNTFFGHVRTKEKKGRLIIAARLRKMLCGIDLMKPSGSRQFVVQNFDVRLKESVCYYVSTVKLSLIGGDLFKKWKAQEETGIYTINESFEAGLIEVLMESTAKYDDLVIMKHSMERLIRIARQFRIHKLMRAIEEQLLETKLMNWDEKLLLALQYRMSPLYVQIQRKYLLSPWTILCRVQRLLISRFKIAGDKPGSNPYDMLHKHLLELIMLSEENICVG